MCAFLAHSLERICIAAVRTAPMPDAPVLTHDNSVFWPKKKKKLCSKLERQ